MLRILPSRCESVHLQVNGSLCSESLPGSFTEWDELARAELLECTTLLSGLLASSQGDRMLMAHSVEGGFRFWTVM